MNAGSHRVRDARPEDADDITSAWILSWQAAYAGQLPDDLLAAQEGRRPERIGQTERAIAAASPQRRVIVGEIDGRVMGFASVGPARAEPGSVGEVYAIYLHPAAWDRGLGRELFAAADAFLASAGFTEAILWVLRTNERARRFYEAAGWHADGGDKVEVTGGVALDEVRYRTRLDRDR